MLIFCFCVLVHWSDLKNPFESCQGCADGTSPNAQADVNPGYQANQPTSPSAEDVKTFDIVRATQYGVLERCQELVEGGFDVNLMDKENVSLLHWAAINNRGDIVRYKQVIRLHKWQPGLLFWLGTGFIPGNLSPLIAISFNSHQTQILQCRHYREEKFTNQ